MIINCDQCNTKYRINSSLIKETGTQVRCSTCQAVFTVFKSDEQATPASEETQRKLGTETLEKELADLYAQTDDNSKKPRVTAIIARPPRPAENNPINLIKHNGDNFVRSEDSFVPRSAPKNEPPAPPESELDLGLGDEPILTQAQPLRADLGPNVMPSENPPIPPIPTPNLSASDKTNESSSPQPIRLKTAPWFTKRQKLMLLALSVFAAILVVSTFFLSLKTNTTSDKAPSSSEAKSSSENKAPAPTAANQPNAAASAEKPPEPEILNLIFTQEQNQDSFHYINNADVGQILVILGRIQNGYDEPVSHIRVKAALKNSAGAILAERQVFAGNTLTQEELQTLSMKEILAKLSLRGGQNGLNLNISPGKEVPYMFVFDKLPGDLKEYQVEPVSCVLTSQALSSIQSPPAATPDPAAPNRR